MAIQAHLPGGGFLLGESDPQDVHAPEDFTDEHHLLAHTIREFITQEVLPRTEAIEAKEEGVIPELLKKAGDIGLLSMEVPEKFGGAGMGLTSGMLLMETAGLGGGSFLTSIADHIGIGTLPIVYSGSDELRQRYLPQLATGEKLGCYCLTEPQSGSDALAAQTSAELSADGTHYLLNGAKHYITNAAFSDLFTVFAKVDKTLFTAFVVERDAGGMTIGKEEHKMGIVGSSTCPVYLENTPVPVENVLGEVGAGHRVAFNILNVGRLKLGAGCLGGMKFAISAAIPYAKERHQFDRPIASFGLIQQKIADMAIRTYVLESLIYRSTGLIEARLGAIDETADDYDAQVIKSIEEYAVECSIAKVAGSEMLDFVVDEMVQIYGGLGFIEESPAPRAYRDARINRIFEGTNEINRLIIPETLMRRAMRGQLPLMDAVQQVTQNLLAPLPPLMDSDDDPLHVERQLIERCKQGALLCAGVVVQRYQQELAEQQEVLGMIADMAIEIYTAESALLRTLKCLSSEAGDPDGFRLDMTRAWCRALPEKIERLGASTLAASAEGDALTTPLAALKKLTRVIPANTVAMKRRVAAIMIDAERYPL
ncbi:MAG: acyl-CoA dehydrogenase family protein [Candidatus Tectomicrobia bacterium]|nr:acyl-CoA dehydrogenase family protein [Candidatus Tectomicrobia bacterium]